MRLKRSFERAICHYDVIVVVVIPELFTNVCLQNGNVVARDSGVDTTNRSCLVNVNKRLYQMYVGYMVGLLMWTVGSHECLKTHHLDHMWF